MAADGGGGQGRGGGEVADKANTERKESSRIVVGVTTAQLCAKEIPPSIVQLREARVEKLKKKKKSDGSDRQNDNGKSVTKSTAKPGIDDGDGDGDDDNDDNDLQRQRNVLSPAPTEAFASASSSSWPGSGLLLSVTLLAENATRNAADKAGMNNDVATEVLLEILDTTVNLNDDNNRVTVLASKRLTWPETVFAGDRKWQKKQSDGKKNNWFLNLFGIHEEDVAVDDDGDDTYGTRHLTDGHRPPEPTSARTTLVKQIHDRQQQSVYPQRPIGIVSATLCRQGGRAGARSSALDLIQSMNMGVGPSPQPQPPTPRMTTPPAAAPPPLLHAPRSIERNEKIAEELETGIDGGFDGDHGGGDDTSVGLFSDDGGAVRKKAEPLGDKMASDENINKHTSSANHLRELRLVCISHEGKLHIYDPWKLLLGVDRDNPIDDGTGGQNTSRTSSKVARSVSSDEAALDAVTKLFLGHDLFQTLQDHWRPLSEPIATIHPSVFQQDAANPNNRKWILFGAQRESIHTEVTATSSTRMNNISTSRLVANTSSNQESKLSPRRRAGHADGKGGDIENDISAADMDGAISANGSFLSGPVVDSFLWNPLMETATLSHRTLDNRPQQLSVAGTAYVVVTGRGIPYGRGHGRSTADSHQFEKERNRQHHGLSGRATTTRTSFQSSNRREPIIESGIKRQWWDHSSGASEEQGLSGQTNEKIDDMGSGDHQYGRVDDGDDDHGDAEKQNSNTVVEANGGFVTFISTARWSESRTLFLPFPPCSVSHVSQWMGMELLLVLGESEAVAIRIDMASSGPSLVPVGAGPFAGEATLSGFDSVSTDLLRKASADTILGKSASSIDASVDVDMSRLLPPTFLLVNRYQILPIDMDRKAKSLSPRLLCGSATGVMPPSLLELYVDSEPDHTPNVGQDPSVSTPPQRGLVLLKTLSHCTAQGSVALHHDSTKVAKLVVSPRSRNAAGDDHNDGSTMNVWGQHGQGWSVVGTNGRIYFICWDGATTMDGAYVKEMGHPLPSTVSSIAHGSVCHVLPVDSAEVDTTPTTNDSTEPKSVKPTGGPFDRTQLRFPFPPSLTNNGIDTDLIVQAIEGLSNPHVYASLQSTASNYSLRPDQKMGLDSSFIVSRSDIGTTAPLSYKEKSERLLQHCSSWTQLQGTLDDRVMLAQRGKIHFAVHLPVNRTSTSPLTIALSIVLEPLLGLRVGADDTPMYLFTLRRVVVANGPGSPFQQILAWLAKRDDFFTAASVALDLLQDRKCLLQLWKDADLIGADLEDTSLEGLLDGIIPIDAKPHSHSASQETATMAHLADMTVGCLIKGGGVMSGTLRTFLSKNESYDPARASLMLAATTAIALSGDPSLVAAVAGTVSGKSTAINVFYGDLLWPVECLLQIGISRNYLDTALLLLSVTIPDELRNRARLGQSSLQEAVHHVPTTTAPNMEMTKVLVSLIVTSDTAALDMLFDLEDGESRLRYWPSLDHETRLTLSLIEIEEAFTLLRHPEVRTWVREVLNLEIEQSSATGTGYKDSFSPMLPTAWLQRLCVACLTNGGCDLTDFEIDDGLEALMTSSELSQTDAAHDHDPATLMMAASERGNLTFEHDHDVHDDGLKKHRLEIIETRNALMPKLHSHPNDSTPAYSLDFDLIVPCLLLLHSRNAPWMPQTLERTRDQSQGTSESTPLHVKKPNFASTQTMLDATCHLAGRRATFEAKTILTLAKKNDHGDDESNLFASFDSRTAMRQCFLSKNVSAGASLIGGKNGLILHVCDVLMQELGVSMAQAESYLLDDQLNLRMVKGRTTDHDMFKLSPAHWKLLWLLEEHVLSITTYGQFETVHMRGRVDPVFASRSIFRAWLSICVGNRQAASKWMSSWLGRRLEIVDFSNTDGGRPERYATRTVVGHRLACAALARSLIWPSRNGDFLAGHIADEDEYVPLGRKMGMDRKLLIGICQACIGLVESVPIYALDDSSTS